MMNRFRKTPLYLSVICLLIPVLLGGFSLLPEKLNQLRNWYFIIIGLNLTFSISSNYRAYLRDLWAQRDELSLRYRLTTICSYLFLFIFIKISLLNYSSFGIHAIDFSYFDLLIPNSLNGKWFYSEACNCNHFGVHSTLIIYILTPIYLLFKNSLVLLLSHPIILWISVFPLKKILIEKKFNNFEIFSIIFCFLNFSYVSRILSYNFHIEVFYIPLFFYLFYYFPKRATLKSLAIVLLILNIKEDSSVYLCSYFLFYFLSNKTLSRDSFLLGVLSFIFFIFNLKYFIPLNRGSEEYIVAGTASKYTGEIKDIVIAMIRDIPTILKEIITGKWIKTLIPFLFIPLLSPWFWVTMILFIILHSSASSPQMSSLMLYYSAPIIPFLFYSMIRSNTFLKYKSKLTPTLILTFTLIGGGSLSFSNYKEDIFDIKEVKSIIKKGSSICTQGVLFPQLSHHYSISSFRHNCFNKKQDAYIINDTLSFYPISKEVVYKFLKPNTADYTLHTINNFRIYLRND